MNPAGRLTYKQKRTLTYGLFLLGPVVLFVGAFVYPIIDTIILSLHEWDGISVERTFVGVAENYRILFGLERFHHALANNLRWLAFYLVVPTLAGLASRCCSIPDVRGTYIFRTIFFIPFTITTVAVASAWRWLYEPTGGLFIMVLTALGLEKYNLNWLGDPEDRDLFDHGREALGMERLHVPHPSGLRNLPAEYIEAARIDGASPLAILMRIKLPLLWPSTIVILGIAGVDSMRVFDIVWSMTQGGPFELSSVLAVAMYETSFSRFLMGQGAAFAVALLMLAAVVVMPYIYYLSSRVEDIRE